MSTPDLSKPNCEPFFRERKVKKHKNSEDKREDMDRGYLSLIRQLPCCIPSCRSAHRIEAHHVRCLDPTRAKGKKPLDKTALPLCWAHHGYGADGIHSVGTRQEDSWLRERGVDALNLATSLWMNKHDLKRMQEVLHAHWERERP
jgi:hypothetical protein